MLRPTRRSMADDAHTSDDAGTAIRAFLIADVRGYTSYTQAHGDEAAARLAASFADVVRQAVTASGGRLVELRGDEALVVFGSPRQAIRTAVELQRRLVEESVATGLPLRVGMGLDAGEAVPVGDGFRGGALNLAARLCARAGPREVLVSEGLAHLARKVDDLAYADRGRVSLKGLEAPVRVYQVVFPLEVPAGEAPGPARWRDPRVLAGLAVAAIALVAAAVVALTTGLGGSEPSLRVNANAAGLIDAASGTLERTAPAGNGPVAIALGADSVWVANAVDHSVSRIDADGDEPTTVIPVPGLPGGIAAGGGAAWVSDASGSSLAQIDLESNTVVPRAVRVGNGPSAMAFADGALWVANTVDYTVSRVDPRTGRETASVRVDGRPDGIAVAHGSVWVASGDTATVTQIDARTRQVVHTIPVGHGASAITGGFGSVWVANTVDGTVTRIEPASGSVQATSEIAPRISALAASHGALWAASPLRREVLRIDPASGRVTKAVQIGAPPAALAASGDSVWLAAPPPLARHRGGTLRLTSFLAGCNCVDPAFAYEADEWRLLTIVFDGLVAYRKAPGAAGASLVPDLAEALPRPEDGGLTYRFRLRAGLRYSNGQPVRAGDFRASMERLVRLNRVTLPPFYASIIGTDRCSTECDLSRGIVTDDASRTITLHLSRPDPELLNTLALPLASVLPPGSPAPRKPVTGEAYEHVGTYLPVGTGPYRLASFQPRRSLVLERNPRFRAWSSDAQPDGFPDRIVVDVIGDGNAPLQSSTAADALSGRSDWAGASDPGRVRALAVSHPAQLHIAPQQRVDYFFFNVRRPPFDNPLARQAFALAVDRSRISRIAGGRLLAPPTCQMLPPAFPGYRPYCPWTVRAESGTWSGPDLARARALVRRSGTQGARVTLVAQKDDRVRTSIADEAAHTLRALGYRATVRLVPDLFGSVTVPHPDANIFQLGWFADYAAASNFILLLFGCASDVPASANVTGFCSRPIDDAMGRARRLALTDQGAADAAWSRIDRALVDAAPAVPLYAYRGADVVSPRVANYLSSAQFGVLVDQLWVR
jgi:ABC-type transport system substrate-binding protein/class 3 adenylate cyclase